MDSTGFPIKYFTSVRMKYVGVACVLFALISLVMKPSHADLKDSAVARYPSVSLEDNAGYQHHQNKQFASLGQTCTREHHRPGLSSQAEPAYQPMVRSEAEKYVEKPMVPSDANAALEPVEDWWPEPSYCRFDQLKPSSLAQKNADHPVLEKPDQIDEGASYTPSLKGLLMDAAIACLMDPTHLARIMDTLEIVEEHSSVPPPYFSLAPQAALVSQADPAHQSEAKGALETFEKRPSASPLPGAAPSSVPRQPEEIHKAL